MKKNIYNIHILLILVLTMTGTLSCSDDLQEAGDVRVNFTATLPFDLQTRSFGKAEQVNTLVVGVFKKGVADEYVDSRDSWNYYETGRKSFPINGSSIDVQLTLAQEQTYSFVFWAYDNRWNIYNVNDLTAIEMNSLPKHITFAQAEAADAFFATMENITVTENCSYPVELVRPLAQINVGTTGMPKNASFTAKSAPDTFHPFAKSVSGTTDFTWNFNETTTETFPVDGKEYNYLAMGYIFAPTTTQNISATLTLSDGETNKTIELPLVELEANQRSNIVGNFTQQQEN